MLYICRENPVTHTDDIPIPRSIQNSEKISTADDSVEIIRGLGKLHIIRFTQIQATRYQVFTKQLPCLPTEFAVFVLLVRLGLSSTGYWHRMSHHTCREVNVVVRALLNDARRRHRNVAGHLAVFDSAGAAAFLQDGARARSVLRLSDRPVSAGDHSKCVPAGGTVRATPKKC